MSKALNIGRWGLWKWKKAFQEGERARVLGHGQERTTAAVTRPSVGHLGAMTSHAPEMFKESNGIKTRGNNGS